MREAVGVCGIPSELYKFGSTNLHRCLLLLFNLMYNDSSKGLHHLHLGPNFQDREAPRHVFIFPTSQFSLHGKKGNDISPVECKQA